MNEHHAPEATQAFQAIKRYREQHGLPSYDCGDSETGTVASVDINGRVFYGLNATLSPDSRPLREKTLAALQQAFAQLENVPYRRVRFLGHAEAHALIVAKEALGQLPKEVTVYVDRNTCGFCRSEKTGLGLLRERYGLEKLTVIPQDGKPATFPKEVT